MMMMMKMNCYSLHLKCSPGKKEINEVWKHNRKSFKQNVENTKKRI